MYSRLTWHILCTNGPLSQRLHDVFDGVFVYVLSHLAGSQILQHDPCAILDLGVLSLLLKRTLAFV